MNLIGFIVLAALLLEFGTGVVAALLNLRALSTAVPGEFRDQLDADTFLRSQRYTREKTVLGLVERTVGLVALLAFWWAGGFAWLDGWCRGPGWSPVPTGLVFIGVLGALSAGLSLPFEVFDTFVLEERFGFNRTNWGTFVKDRLKGVLLAVALGAPLLGALLWFFGALGSVAWLVGWLFLTAVTLALQYVAPRWLLPLFNRYEPLADGPLKAAILRYAESVGFAIAELFVMDGSKRSAKANAFFTGFGRNRRVALFDTLIEKHPVEELVAVLAHEIGHYKKRHIQKGLVLGIAHTGVLFFLLSTVLESPPLFEAFYVSNVSVYAGLVFFALLYTPVEFVLGLYLHRISRKHEFEADAFAAATTDSPERLIQALKRLSVDHLANLTPHPVQVALSYSHPPVLRRIEALRALAKPESR